jgi:hypothetical protein
MYTVQVLLMLFKNNIVILYQGRLTISQIGVEVHMQPRVMRWMARRYLNTLTLQY